MQIYITLSFSGEVNQEIDREFLSSLKNKFPSVNYKIMGQAEEAADSGKRLGIAFLISIILIAITISLNFKSLSSTNYINGCSNWNFFSYTWTWYNGKAIFTLSVWGVIALIGILVNDAVVMLDKFNRNLNSGMTIFDAVSDAGKVGLEQYP